MPLLRGKLDPRKFNSTWLAILVCREFLNIEFANVADNMKQAYIDKAQSMLEEMVRRGIIE